MGHSSIYPHITGVRRNLIARLDSALQELLAGRTAQEFNWKAGVDFSSVLE